MPFFSIIMPTYNRAHLIQKSIESVIDQTHSDWELIIVDDGSSDNTCEVVQEFNDARVRYIYQENQERSAARNNGMRHANGAYICFLDSDDWYEKDRLRTLNAALEKATHRDALFFTDIAFYNAGTVRHVCYDRSYTQQPFEFLMRRTLGTPQVILSKVICEKFQFNEKFKIGEDMELWLRIAQKYPLEYLTGIDLIVALEHDERSINVRSDSDIQNQADQMQFILAKDHSGTNITSAFRREIRSQSQFNIAQYYMRTNQRKKALRWVLKSLFSDRRNTQFKHRLYCFYHLSMGKIPAEYITK